MNAPATPQPVLLVEDNDDDIFIFTRNFQKLGLKHPLQVVHNGAEALEYFRGSGAYHDREKFPIPRLVLLDLKLPLQTGLDVLEWMRQQAEFATVPVVVLTSSAELRDIARARKLHASAYLVKPPRREVLRKIFADLDDAGEDGPHFDVEGDRLTRQSRPPL